MQRSIRLTMIFFCVYFVFSCGIPFSGTGDDNSIHLPEMDITDTPVDNSHPALDRWNTETVLTPQSGVRFGYAVAVSRDGNTIAAGDPEDDIYGPSSGSVSIYRYNGLEWTQTEVYASDGSEGARFGSSVAVSTDGRRVAVGTRSAYRNREIENRVYIYQLEGGTWEETIIMPPVEQEEGALFGASLALSDAGNMLVAGAPVYDADTVSGINSGAFYIYRYDGVQWRMDRGVTAGNEEHMNLFGCSVAVSAYGSRIISGACKDPQAAENAGSLYIYDWNGSDWVETRIAAVGGSANDYFGRSVAISADGNSIAAGAHGDDDGGNSSGSVYLYRWDGIEWTSTKLRAFNGEPEQNLGISVSISSDGSMIAAGTGWWEEENLNNPDGNHQNISTETAYIFSLRNNQIYENRLTASESVNGSYYGFSIAISGGGEVVISGSPGMDSTASTGNVYVYR